MVLREGMGGLMSSKKSDLLYGLGEPFAAGMFEDENASIPWRYARGICRHFEHAPALVPTGLLGIGGYQAVWNLNHAKLVRYDYNSSISVDWKAFEEAISKTENPFHKTQLRRAQTELANWLCNPVPQRYAIGGAGWIHGIIHYERILDEGLLGYKARMDNKPDDDFFGPLKAVLDAVISYLKRCPYPFNQVPLHPARNFKEAMAAFAFCWYLDGCDSIGRFDNVLGKYYHGEPEAFDLVRELWTAFDVNNGWHAYLDGTLYPDFTELCIRAQNGIRRPNTGLRITSGTRDDLWEAVFDAWQQGNPTPSLYNDKVYRNALPGLTGIDGDDLDHYAFGGCTELMVEGRSQVGSIDAGLNLLEIYQSSGSEKAFYEALPTHVDLAVRSVVLEHEVAKTFRPQLIRTLLVDDCIENGRDFRDCGARYNGSAINLAGGTDTINAIAKERGLTGKFGNDDEAVDAIAAEMYGRVFDLITSRRTYGFCLPSVILLTTFAQFGHYVPATTGRDDGTPLTDSVGARQGTDLKGPTALLNSTAKIPSSKAVGTLILNLRLNAEMMSEGNRPRLKALIQGFFAQGGMQVQMTIIDQKTLLAAYENPDAYPNLLVRIGGYSEYFRRLSRELQGEILKRTEHSL